MRLIDADRLYEQTAEWESRALAIIEKMNSKPFDEMDASEIVEWRKWSCILTERSAFKHDVFDAPTVEPASPWHRVEEELPNDGEWAIFTNGKVVSVERFKVDAYNHFFPASKWFAFEDAIAWMPLPEPPKEDA